MIIGLSARLVGKGLTTAVTLTTTSGCTFEAVCAGAANIAMNAFGTLL